jgi:branched-subunit amino acid ABC-type transport system permease component
MLGYLEPIINGILLGGLYGVVGVGLSMVFGIMRQVNLAHGELMILSSYFSLLCLSSCHVYNRLFNTDFSLQQGYAKRDGALSHDLFRAFHHLTERPAAYLYS